MNNQLQENLVSDKLISQSYLPRYDENIISLTLFGSYNTEFWNEGKSNIDILVLVKYSDFNVEYKLKELKNLTVLYNILKRWRLISLQGTVK